MSEHLSLAKLVSSPGQRDWSICEKKFDRTLLSLAVFSKFVWAAAYLLDVAYNSSHDDAR